MNTRRESSDAIQCAHGYQELRVAAAPDLGLARVAMAIGPKAHSRRLGKRPDDRSQHPAGDVDLAEGCDLLCVPKREDPRDVLLTRDGTELMGLSAGSRVGTVSLRRISQLKAQRPDLAFDPLCAANPDLFVLVLMPACVAGKLLPAAADLARHP